MSVPYTGPERRNTSGEWEEIRADIKELLLEDRGQFLLERPEVINRFVVKVYHRGFKRGVDQSLGYWDPGKGGSTK